MNSSPQAVGNFTPQGQAMAMQAVSPASSFNLQHILRILVRRRKIIIVSSALSFSFLAARVFYERVFHPIYSGSFTLLTSSPISSVNQESSSSVSALSRGSGVKQDTSTLVEVLQSVSVRENINRQFLRRFPDSQIPSLQVSVPGSRPGSFSPPATLIVSTSGNSVNDALAYLKIVEQEFLGWSHQERIQNLQDGLVFLDQQEPELKLKLAQLESNRQRYSAKYNTLDPLAELESLSSSLAERRSEIQQLSQVRSQLLDTKNSLNTAAFLPLSFSASITSSASGSTGQSVGSGSSSIGYSSSLELGSKNDADLQEFAKLEQAITEARSVYSPGSSYLKNLLAKRKELIPALRRKQASVLNDAIIKVSQDLSLANSALGSGKFRYQELTNSLKEYNPIISEKSLITANLDELIRSKQSFRLQLAQNSSNWKILSPAYVSPDPVSPNVSSALLQSLLISLALGSAVAYARDRLDVVFHNDSELQEEIGLPLLAHVPYIESLTQSSNTLNKLFDADFGADGVGQKNYHYGRFYFQESFRNLVTSLRFSAESAKLSSLAITSSVPSEGKSTIIALLAKTYSDFGSRVLLIDADMRLPQIHKRLGLNNLTGLSNILTANIKSWQDCVQCPDGWPNVGVITAGIIPPDPPRLLASEAMKQLISDIKKYNQYDLILIDLPPVMGLSDSLIASSYFDAVALVVSIGKVDRRLPRRAVARIQECSSRCIGVIANQVTAAKASLEAQSYLNGYSYEGKSYRSSLLEKYFKGAMAPHSATQAATSYDYYLRGLSTPEQQSTALSQSDGKGSAAKLSFSNFRRNLVTFSKKLQTWLDS
jgi:polysaccharide biosynthesis transport protein